MALTTEQKVVIGLGTVAGISGILLIVKKVLGAPPELKAEANGPYSGVVGEPLTLHGSASGGTPPYTYAWDMDNDGVYETPGQNPTGTWAEAGTYTIHLKVTDDAGDEATDEASVMITTLATEITDFAIRANNSQLQKERLVLK